MGLMDALFGGKDKTNLVRSLVKRRVARDPNAAAYGQSQESVDGWPTAMVMGLPEATLVTIVETYCKLRKQGMSDRQIIERIEGFRSQLQGPASASLPLTLSAYIAYRIDREHPSVTPMTSDEIESAVKQATAFFGA